MGATMDRRTYTPALNRGIAHAPLRAVEAENRARVTLSMDRRSYAPALNCSIAHAQPRAVDAENGATPPPRNTKAATLEAHSRAYSIVWEGAEVAEEGQRVQHYYPLL